MYIYIYIYIYIIFTRNTNVTPHGIFNIIILCQTKLITPVIPVTR